MPEFHFRRAKGLKRNVRRHTVPSHSIDQREQLQRALEMYEEHHEVVYGPNEISVDDAVAGRRVNTIKDQNGITSTNSATEPSIKANVVRKISSKYSECIYLRYGSEMRRCPMPSPITLSTIKQLFVNMFDLSPLSITCPTWHLFILDRANTWKLLENASFAYDRCTILLVDSSDIGTLIPSPLSIDPRQSRSSTGTPDNELLFTPSPNDLNEPSHGIGLRPQSLDLSLLPSVSRNKDIKPKPDNHLNPSSTGNSSAGVFLQQSLRRHSLALQPQTPAGMQMLGFYNQVQHLKHDLVMLKEEHKMKTRELQLQFQLTKDQILAAVHGFSVPQTTNTESNRFRYDRIVLDKIKQEYMQNSTKAHQNLSMLQVVVDELRVDAVERRCKVDTGEIDALTSELLEYENTYKTLHGQYVPFEQKLKDIMRQELTVIVNEESFVGEEPSRLEDGIELCGQLSETLNALKQISLLQGKRSPLIPIIATNEDTDRSALMMSITNIVPDHEQRAESVRLAEEIQLKRKLELSPSRRALKEFEKSLKHQQSKLKVTSNLESIEKQQENKIHLFYMDEKLKRQQEIEKELQIKEEMRKKKKQKELDTVKAKLKIEQERIKEEEEKEMIRIEREKLEMERKKNEEERAQLDKLKRQHEEEEKKKKAMQKFEEEERKRLENERMKELEESLRLEMERKKDKELKKIEKQRLQEVENMLKLEIKREKFEERKKLEEERQLLNELLSNDSPNLKAKRRELLWKQIQERAWTELEEEKKKTEKDKQLKSQQTVMDNHLTTMAGSTPGLFSRNAADSKTEYVNSFSTHRSTPYLLSNQESSQSLKTNGVSRQFHHLDSLSNSFPSAPTQKKLGPSLSIELNKHKEEPSYDSLEKLFKSAENVTQNHYDLPWSSKKLPGLTAGMIQRRGTFGSSPGNHRRNKSELVADTRVHDDSFGQRENLTPSPGFHHHTYASRSSCTPPLRNSPVPCLSKISSHKPKLPVYEDVEIPHVTSPVNNGHKFPEYSPLVSKPILKKMTTSIDSTSIDSSPSLHSINGLLPSYNQAMTGSNKSSPAAAHRHRSNTTNTRLTHYPLATNPQRQKPSVSYV